MGDKDKIADLFINHGENSNLIDQNKRKDTLIRMMKKKSGYYEDCGRVGQGNLKLEDHKNKNSKINNNFLDEAINSNEKNFEFLEHKRKREKISYDPEIEPKIKVMEYIYENEKKNLNRNTI